MATVYLARDVKHDREVALKVLRADLSAVLGTERFLAEVRIAAQLDHPHILTLIDSGEADGILYYVLPYVRGESLRAKLLRERQLSVEEALSITTQVASALDYAHGKGVVHRDIKPENILLHEGVAVLADFGIALAVKEASGNRMTETGLSLGTPQYMSPEQATGDRTIDRRSDVYSLAAVFYEMIAGEPPVTGVSAQAVIAKLMTEKPVRLRVLRDSLPEAMDRATTKALAKVPADRFTSAGEYARALAAAASTPESTGRRVKPQTALAAAALLIVIAGGVWAVGAKSDGTTGPRAVLQDRTQITFTGRVTRPTITADGKTIAYVVSNCGTNGCRYGVEMQDIGATSSRRILDGARAIYGIKLSPDRRNLLLYGTINAAYGSFIVPTLGGTPRYLGSGSAAFWANGDSLAFARSTEAADVFWVLLSGVDGVAQDSIAIRSPAKELGNIIPVPGSGWFIVGLANDDFSATSVVVVNRQGRVVRNVPELKNAGLSNVSTDAAWFTASAPGGGNTGFVLRIPFDAKTGKLDERADTMYTGALNGFDVVEDGTRMVIVEEAVHHTVWALPFADALKGNFSATARIFRTTSGVFLRMARDGSYLGIARNTGPTEDGREWVLLPFGTRTEIPVPGRHLDLAIIDSVTLKLMDKTPSGVEFIMLDRRTGRRSSVLGTTDSTIFDIDNLPGGGWVWIPPGGRSIRARNAGQPERVFQLPKSFRLAFGLSSSRDGKSIAVTGWNAPSMDSLIIATMSLPDGTFSHVTTMSAEGGAARWMDDGTLGFHIMDTPESATFYKVSAAGRIERVGSIPRPLGPFSVSRDWRRFAAVTLDRTGDAWISRIVKP